MDKGSLEKLAKKQNHTGKKCILIISLALLLIMAVGSTVAYIMTGTSAVTNTFTPAEVRVAIQETKTDSAKSEIHFENVKTDRAVTAYIRATLVIHWKDEINGKMELVPKPDGAVVNVDGALGDDWIKVGDIYYYTLPVEPGGLTGKMLKNAITVNVPKGSKLKCYIEVHAEGIQAVPADAVEAAWADVKVVEGALVLSEEVQG